MKSKKAKFAPVGTIDKVTCRACGQPRALDEFRIFATKPALLYMDFCVECEKREGTMTLYRRYNAYGTKEIIDKVFAAHRVPEIRRTPDQVRLLVPAKPEREPETNEELLQREMARRELCRRRLLFFTTTMMPEYKPGWVHQDICRRLEAFVRGIEEGRSPRLIIAMPPRHGKSQLASDMFPSWILGLHPEWGIIGSSHSQTLPLDFSRNMRDRLRDPEYQAIFPDTKLRTDSQGIEAWKTTKGGGYIAAGVGTGINGKGMHVGILDDALKDAEAASSELIRQNTFNWYQAVFRTRLAPGGGILIIATRWHFDDPTGRVLTIDEKLKKAGVPVEERENWDVISYPALAENDEYLMHDGTIVQGTFDEEKGEVLRLLRRRGDALHPERYPVGELKKLKNGYSGEDGMASAIWNALYQQNPTPDDGDFFQKRDFRYRWLDPAYRPLCRVFMTVDYAISKKTRNDFTVMGVYALDSNDDLYELELRRGRWGTNDIVANAKALIQKHKPEVYAGERGQIHEAVWPVLKEALDKERLYVSVDETLVPIQDKETRARPLQGRMQRNKFFISYDEATIPEVLGVAEREMLQFPNGANDDCVDTRAWAGRLALNISLPNSQRPPPAKKGWQERLNALTGGGDNNFMAA